MFHMYVSDLRVEAVKILKQVAGGERSYIVVVIGRSRSRRALIAPSIGKGEHSSNIQFRRRPSYGTIYE